MGHQFSHQKICDINLAFERVVRYQLSPWKICDINLVLEKLKFISSLIETYKGRVGWVLIRLNVTQYFECIIYLNLDLTWLWSDWRSNQHDI